MTRVFRTWSRQSGEPKSTNVWSLSVGNQEECEIRWSNVFCSFLTCFQVDFDKFSFHLAWRHAILVRFSSLLISPFRPNKKNQQRRASIYISANSCDAITTAAGWDEKLDILIFLMRTEMLSFYILLDSKICDPCGDFWNLSLWRPRFINFFSSRCCCRKSQAKQRYLGEYLLARSPNERVSSWKMINDCSARANGCDLRVQEMWTWSSSAMLDWFSGSFDLIAIDMTKLQTASERACEREKERMKAFNLMGISLMLFNYSLIE